MNPYRRLPPGSEIPDEDMALNDMAGEEAMPSEPPMIGAHRALGQRLEAMYVNPLLSSQDFDEATLGDSTAVPQAPSASASPSMSPEEDVNLPYRQAMEPDARKEMIDFLALRARARKQASMDYQEQGIKGKNSKF